MRLRTASSSFRRSSVHAWTVAFWVDCRRRILMRCMARSSGECLRIPTCRGDADVL